MNINCLVHKSCSVFSKGINATDGYWHFLLYFIFFLLINFFLFKADAEYVQNLLESIGTCDGEIEENLMDVFTALSGSGPAYVKCFFFVMCFI